MAAANDKQQKVVVEDSNRITDLTYQLETLNKHDRLMTEQKRSEGNSDRRVGRNPPQVQHQPVRNDNPPARINSTPSVNINGIVRDFKKN